MQKICQISTFRPRKENRWSQMKMCIKVNVRELPTDLSIKQEKEKSYTRKMFASEFSPPDAFARLHLDLTSKRSVLGASNKKKSSLASADYQREHKLIWHLAKSFRNETRTEYAIEKQKLCRGETPSNTFYFSNLTWYWQYYYQPLVSLFCCPL